MLFIFVQRVSISFYIEAHKITLYKDSVNQLK